MKHLITIQHTQSIHHTNGMVGSWTDWDLSPLGIEQAQRIAQRLPQALPKGEWVLYTSDLLRARRTAQIVGHAMGLEPLAVPQLRERNLGRAVGQSVKWLQENIEVKERTVDDRMFSDTESRRDEWNRLRPFFDQLMEQESRNILIVSHGDLLGVFHAMWLGLDVTFLNRSELSGMAGGVSFLQEDDDGKRRIRRLSDMSFIAP